MSARSSLTRIGALSNMSSSRGLGSVTARYFSDDKGRVLSEEERAAENVYIQKMEREKMEKMKKKAEKEKAEHAKYGAEKKPPETPKS